MKDYAEILRNIHAGARELKASVPETHQAFLQLSKIAMTPGALETKTKELIALALAVGSRCDGCIAHHTQALAKLGATREEVAETLAVAVQMGGGPSFMYSADAMTAFLQAQQAAE